MKESNELFISSSIMEKYSSVTENNTNKLDNTKEETSTNFSSLINNGIYSKGFNKIANRLSVVSDTLKNTRSINRNYLDKFIDLENKGMDLANELTIPKIDHSRSVSINNTYKNINLNKNDGNSVTSGNNVSNSSLNDNYSGNKETVKDITKEEVKNSTLEDIYSSLLKKLSDVSNDNTVKENSINFNAGINKENINSITKEDNIKEVSINDYAIDKHNLEDINNKENDYINNIEDYKDSTVTKLSNINKGE